MNDLVPIGHLQKPHGTKGELRLQIEDAYWKDAKGAAVFFVEQQGQKLPYFKIKIRTGNINTIQLEGVENREAAKVLSSSPLFLRAEDISTPIVQNTAYDGYANFQLIDQNFGEIGTIIEVLELPQQQMALVQYQGREIMIPMNDTFILKIEPLKRKILVELPEGLLDL